MIWGPRGHVAMSGVIFSCHNCTGSATGIQQVEARMLLTSKNAGDSPHHVELLAPYAHSAKGEQLMYRRCQALVTDARYWSPLGDREEAPGP